MTNIATFTDTQIDAAIRAHNKAYDALREAHDLLRQSRVGTHEKYDVQLVLLESDVVLALTDLYTEREYRADCRKRQVAA